MCADYYRYIAENVEGDKKKTFAESSCYNLATQSAVKLGINNRV